MNKESRRKILTGLAISLPAAWAKPAVESVILPVHAGTSGCVVARACYNLDDDGSIAWPGPGDGTRQYYSVVNHHTTSDCTSSRRGGPTTIPTAVASSRFEASDLLECSEPDLTELPSSDLPGRCSFYICEPS